MLFVQFLVKSMFRFQVLHIFFNTLWWKIISWSWNKKKMIKFDKICEVILWRMFPFGFSWVNKISRKNYLALSHVWCQSQSNSKCLNVVNCLVCGICYFQPHKKWCLQNLCFIKELMMLVIVDENVFKVMTLSNKLVIICRRP